MQWQKPGQPIFKSTHPGGLVHHAGGLLSQRVIGHAELLQAAGQSIMRWIRAKDAQNELEGANSA
jgi:hypothetical protein